MECLGSKPGPFSDGMLSLLTDLAYGEDGVKRAPSAGGIGDRKRLFETFGNYLADHVVVGPSSHGDHTLVTDGVHVGARRRLFRSVVVGSNGCASRAARR